MGKGKNKPNAFLAFMLDWKRIQENKGRKFPGGLKDVQIDPVCNEEWRALSDQDKAYYKEMAKNGPSESSKNKKRTGNGELVEDIKLAEQKERAFLDNMKEYISDMVKLAKHDAAIPDIKFYVIHINYFYFRVLDNNQIEYYPAELSLGEFTLRNGVSNIYTVIFNEPIIIGFTQSAKEQSEKCHQIPIEPPFGEGNYCEIFRKICTFLDQGNGKLPPLYTVSTLEDVYPCVKSVLGRLAAFNNKSDEFFTLYSFEELFTIMYNSLDIDRTMEPVVATLELKKDPHAYKPHLCCSYHDNVQVGTLFCSQSLIQRWFYVLCTFCCEPLGILLEPGVHLPQESGFQDPLAVLNMSSLSLNGSRSSRVSRLKSQVKYDPSKHTSERTYAEDQRRKLEARLKPIHIVERNHTTLPPVPSSNIIERPLRAPYSRSVGMNYDPTDSSSSIDFSECNFPSIGRGTIKKRPQKTNEK